MHEYAECLVTDAVNLSASQLPTLAATEKPTVSPEALGSSAAATSIASYRVPQVLPPILAVVPSVAPTQAPSPAMPEQPELECIATGSRYAMLC